MTKNAAPGVETVLGLCRAILRNGDALLEEARILHDHGKSARAYALSVLALEEFSKLPMLNRYAIEKILGQSLESTRWSDVRARMLSHDRKLRMHAWFESPPALADISEDTYRNLRKRGESLHRRKLEAIYVDIKGTRVLSPLVEISASDAEEILGLVDQLRAFHHEIMERALIELSVPLTDEARQSLSEFLTNARRRLSELLTQAEDE